MKRKKEGIINSFWISNYDRYYKCVLIFSLLDLVFYFFGDGYGYMINFGWEMRVKVKDGLVVLWVLVCWGLGVRNVRDVLWVMFERYRD